MLEADSNINEVRLNKYLAACGICSRRDADKLIEAGRVKVNGTAPEKGLKVITGDRVEVDGKIVMPVEKKTVIAYNKPVGVVCTEKDEHAERIITKELNLDKRVTYAGRLDKDSCGLMIMTDDGDLINAMMRGSNKHEKEYIVEVDRDIDDKNLELLRQGIYIKDLDVTTRKCKVVRKGKRKFDIILTQGLNRQIRRMCSELGFNVVTLKRIRIMNVELGNLKSGQYRNLDEKERNELYKLSGL
ncbi:MAG: rRNA pseudouridine synthase [Butyrivibrio sp.]|nr:rRNA pseudouridine synthase [Butyrivibrio sp.]